MRKRSLFCAALMLATSALFAQTAKDGANAAKITNTVSGAWTGDTALDTDANKVAVTPGHTIRLSWWMKSANTGPGMIERVGVAFFRDAAGATHDGDVTAYAGAVPCVWTFYTKDIAVPSTSNFVNVALRVGAGGNPAYAVLFDKVSVVDTAAPGTELLTNGSFENWSGASNAAPDNWRFFAVSGATGSVQKVIDPPKAQGLQTLKKLWKIDAGTSVAAGALPWFKSENDHMTRGLEFNPKTGHLLVADRDTADTGTIYVLDAANGNQIGSFNVDTLSGGVYVLNKVAVDDSGRVFVCNLATAASPSAAPSYKNNFRLYVYPSEEAALASAPSVAYAVDATPLRWGDDLDVVGSSTSTKVLVASRDTTGVLMLSDPEGDGFFASQVLAAPGVGGPGHVAFDTDANKFWFHQSLSTFDQLDYPALEYNADGTPAAAPYRLNIGHSAGAIDVGQISTKILAVTPADVDPAYYTQDVCGYVYDLADNTAAPLFQTEGLQRAEGYALNGNGTGDVVIDEANHRIFFLVTNNSISSWYLPGAYSAAQDWQLLQ